MRFVRTTAAGSTWVTPRMSPSAASRSEAPHDGHVTAATGTVAEHHGHVAVSPLDFLLAGLISTYSHSIVAGGLDEMS
jgi:hypothetical protein